jgi:hypothetical protein
MTQNTRTSALDLYHVDLKQVKKSKAWFDTQIAWMNRKNLTPSAILGTHQHTLTTRIIPSKMYCFMYQPKNAATLPYFDTFPLVLPFGRDADHFIGLNLHYLDYPLRFELFRELLSVSNSTTISDTSKIKYNWEMIKGVSKLAPAQACVKSYLYSQVKSPFMEILPSEWATAAMLPMHRFQGATAQRVWTESSKQRNW